MDICPTGFVCFNREIFIVVVIALIALALYYVHNNETQLGDTSQQNVNETLCNSNHYELNNLHKKIQKQNDKINELTTLNKGLNENNNRINTLSKDNSLYNITSNYDSMNKQTNNYENIHPCDIDNNLNPPERKLPISNNMINSINMSTRGGSVDYQRIGVLYSENNKQGKPLILPLFGKPMHMGSNKWFYYSSTEDYHSIKIPVYKDGKKCQGSYGCDELYDNDLVFVKPYKTKFRVSLYELERPQYLPHIY